jgi:hypothetical protein
VKTSAGAHGGRPIDADGSPGDGPKDLSGSLGHRFAGSSR